MITSNRGNSFSPIEHHAIIGDCHCAALISKQGSLDWLCLPRFDSPAIFGALLDPKKGGHFKIAPIEEYRSEQRYIENTNVLETIFETSGGRLRLTDLMPIAGSRERAKKLFPQRQVLRVIECMDGEMEVGLDFSPRFDYGRIIPQFHDRGRLGLFCGHRGLLLNLRTEFRLGIHEQEGCARGQSRLRQGDRQHVSLAFTLGEPAIIPPIGAEADLCSGQEKTDTGLSHCSFELLLFLILHWAEITDRRMQPVGIVEADVVKDLYSG